MIKATAESRVTTNTSPIMTDKECPFGFQVREVRMKRIALPGVIIILTLLLATLQVSHVVSNPAFSTGDTKAFITYLNSLYRTVIRPDASSVIVRGYQTYPVYNVTGGDYFNYWTDDHGKILLAGALLDDPTMMLQAFREVSQASIRTGQGAYLASRIANSSFYSLTTLGNTTAPNNYYITNRMVAFANASNTESPQTDVFEKAVAVASIWDSRVNTLNSNLKSGPFVASIAPLEIYWGNDTTHIRRTTFAQITPEKVTIFNSLGNPSKFILPYYRIQRLVSVNDTLGVIPLGNVKLEVNVTFVPWRPYGVVTMRVINNWSQSIRVGNVTLAFASADSFLDYVPWFYYQYHANGVIDGPIIVRRGINQTLWNGSGSPIQKVLFSGFATPEFAKGWLANVQSAQYGLDKIIWTTCMAHSVGFIVDGSLSTAIPAGSNTLNLISANFIPQDKIDYYMAPSLFSIDENSLPDGMVWSLAASWGIVTLGVVEYYLATGDRDALTLAEQLWSYQYNDAKQRLAPTWIPENPEHFPSVYFRALYAQALAGLLLDSNNATYKGWAENVTEIAIYQQLDLNLGSPSYGGFAYGLDTEENAWAYALLMKEFQLYSDRSAQTRGHSLRDVIKSNIGFTDQSVCTSWPLGSSSYNQFLPSVYLVDRLGNPYTWANHPQSVFRPSEMLIGLILGAEYEGSDGASLYDMPVNLATVSMLWKMQTPLNSGFAVDARYWDPSCNSNSETQPDGMLALALWKARMWNLTQQVYLNRIYKTSLTSISYSKSNGDLRLTLQSTASATGANITLYYPNSYQDGTHPTLGVWFSNGTNIANAVAYYSTTSKMLSLRLTFPTSGSLTIEISQTQQPVGPPLAIIAGVGAVVAVAAGVIHAARKQMQSSKKARRQ
jgi:hypothetical protein